MSLSVVKTTVYFDVDVCPIELYCIVILRLPVIVFELNARAISVIFIFSKNLDPKR